MNIIKHLSSIKEHFNKGENIIQLLKRMKNENGNSIETILISYDFQAGTYTKGFWERKDFFQQYSKLIAEVIQKYHPSLQSIIEVGVGEATTLANVVSSFSKEPANVYGFDISWSRIKYARQFMNELSVEGTLFTGDLFNMPLKSNSIDVVYTSHSIEPNGGKEKEALQELYRVAKDYVVLLEPCYELAEKEAKERMLTHGYVTRLQEVIKELNYEVLEFRLFDMYSNPLNPTGLTVIKKKAEDMPTAATTPFACPITLTDLNPNKNAYFSKESMLAYPIIDGIPCLLPSNAVVATHFEA